jgi:hypothetical protein
VPLESPVPSPPTGEEAVPWRPDQMPAISSIARPRDTRWALGLAFVGFFAVSIL